MNIKNIINFYKKEKKFIKYGAIGIISVITSIILLRVVLDIADYTANFGDKFRSQKLFIIKEAYNIRKGPSVKTDSLYLDDKISLKEIDIRYHHNNINSELENFNFNTLENDPIINKRPNYWDPYTPPKSLYDHKILRNCKF